MWVDESDAYKCSTCNALFYAIVKYPDNSTIFYCPCCGDENVISEDTEDWYSDENEEIDDMN